MYENIVVRKVEKISASKDKGNFQSDQLVGGGGGIKEGN